MSDLYSIYMDNKGDRLVLTETTEVSDCFDRDNMQQRRDNEIDLDNRSEFLVLTGI